MNFHFIWYLWNELCVFISPSLWQGDIQTHKEFHKYRMKWKFISDFFYHMLNQKKNVKKNWVSLPISLRKTRHRRDVTYEVIDELWRLGLSKCFLALCHKLIYEISIFHSINRETCDKYNYVIIVTNQYHTNKFSPHVISWMFMFCATPLPFCPCTGMVDIPKMQSENQITCYGQCML